MNESANSIREATLSISTPRHSSKLGVLIEVFHLAVIATAMAFLYWWPLPIGGGFIGGDTYNYFMPLRYFYASGLHAHELHLWHPGIGNGVPVLGESQTGVFYPFYLLAYSTLDLNSAYSAVFLSHYVLAYMFTYALARVLGLRLMASHFASMVFVYGWFPPRACLEWAIVTGTWLPAILATSIRFKQTGRWRWLWGTALAIALQLLAGHFNLAWVTVLAASIVAILYFPHHAESNGSSTSPRRFSSWWSRTLGIGVALLLGFLLAAPQLLPAWELKQRSQRSNDSFREEIEQGLIPLPYFAQAVEPWKFYSDPDGVLRDMGAKTNKIEAHLYFGLVPLALAVIGLITGRTIRDGWPWLVLAIIGATLASGGPMPALAHVPGFGFFRYCGRYSLMSEIGVAVLAGMALDRFPLRSITVRNILGIVVAAVTFADLYLVGHAVQYVTIVDPPIINFRDESIAFKKLLPTDRVLAVDGNTLALSGAACVPPYLGMGPAEYYQLWSKMPNVFQGEAHFDDTIADILAKTGVTHLLVFKPLPSDWPVTLVWHGFDPFLHRRWARDPAEPIYLYRYDRSVGRAYLRDEKGKKIEEGEITIREYAPHRVVIEANSPVPADVVLTDISFPGWSVTIDDKDVNGLDESFNRIVHMESGKHRIVWTYTPWSLYTGLAVSAGSLILAILLTIVIVRGMRSCRPVTNSPSGQM
ncbi:YfhO family protein [bacterium]|nr:YfhO family protein [bacterium]